MNEHGAAYWLFVGWWLAPLKWFGRVALWILFWPVGLWRSIVHGQRKRDRRNQFDQSPVVVPPKRTPPGSF